MDEKTDEEANKQAAEKAQSTDPKKVAAAIHSGMTFNTVIGSFSFRWMMWPSPQSGAKPTPTE